VAERDLVVTFDLFSALIDSRTGGTAALEPLAAERHWEPSPGEVYDDWDARNKTAQRGCETWRSYVSLAGDALTETYAALRLDGDAATDLSRILDTLPEWPLWPDVEANLTVLSRRFRIGLLSNVDDDLFRRTRAAPYVEPELAMTSERLGAYKPDPRIYHRTQEALGRVVHVATSARDVRGAVEAGIPVVRLRRPGHGLDADGPRPDVEAGAMDQLEELVPEAWSRLGDG